MKKFTCFIFFVTVICIAAFSFGDVVSKSTLDDQKSLEITVYNSNIGLVKDTRNIRLPVGAGELRFMDVASYIMPKTVHVKSLNFPDKLAVLEQNYEYDLMNADKLLDKYVGKEIKLIEWNEFKGTADITDAVLLSNNNGQIYRINNSIYLGHPGYHILPEIPENLIADPTLTWLYDNKSDETHSVEVSYLTDNINWSADYVLVIDKEDKLSDLTGWVTLDNRSGATYKNAALKLVAGTINRVDDFSRVNLRKGAMVTMEASAPQFEEKSFFEYHIYNLTRRTTIKNNQTKQITLLEAGGINIKKEFVVYGAQSYYTNLYQEEIPKQPVNVRIKFQNLKSNNLGIPLPEGVVRLYKKDQDGSQQFIGEDRITHTPKDEEITLKVGEAFDVTAKRKQSDFKKIPSVLRNVYESEWEVTLKNHKEEDVTISLMEPLYGSWQVISSSHAYEKKDAFTIKFSVNVPKNGEASVKYRIRVEY